MLSSALLAVLALAPQAHEVARAAAPTTRGLVLPLDREGALELATWAESPALYNPTAIDVDARGRVWVAEAVNYRTWGGRNPGLRHPEGDRVVILEDADGDGRAERSTVFVQDPELVAPLGICVLEHPPGRSVLVSSSPRAWLYVDRDGDDVVDERRVFLEGFGGHDHDHGLHSFVPGPDGALYAAVGNAGPHLVTDASGWHLRSGNLDVGGAPGSEQNRPGLVSDDGRVWTGGLLLRVGQDGAGLSVLAHNFRNEYELALDAFGDAFTRDNDDDGNASCRTVAVLDGANHGYFSPDGARWWQLERRPGQAIPAAHWHADDPGVAPSGTIDGAGGPTGVVVCEGGLLAPWVGGALLGADAGAGAVFAHRPRRAGAGWTLERELLLTVDGAASDERARWFRPSDLALGLAGELYVADWFDPAVGGHGMGDREAYGRILRVAPKGFRASATQADASTPEAALACLASPAASVRELGRSALAAQGEHALPVLRAALAGADARLAARACWILAALDDGRASVEAELARPEETRRLVALRALRRAGADVLARTEQLAHDPSPAVRAELALALRDVPLERCGALLVALAEGVAADDRAALEAFGLGCDGKEEALWPQLVAALGERADRWDARFEALAWRLHPPAAVPAFVARVRDARLADEQRERALESLAFVDAREAAEAMLALALAGPAELREQARWWLETRSAGPWSAYGLADELPPEGLDAAELVHESALVRRGEDALVTIEVDLSRATRAWLVATDGGDGNSCDWVAWLEPRVEGAAGTRALHLDDAFEAEAGWGEVHEDRNCVGGPLEVGGRERSGIGTHAPARLGFALEPGDARLHVSAALDDEATRQDGAPSSVRFQVWLERAPDLAHLAALRACVGERARAREERLAAVRELASEDEGAAWLVLAVQRDGLEPELAAAARETLVAREAHALAALLEAASAAREASAASGAAEEAGAAGAAGDSTAPPSPELDARAAAILALSGDPLRGMQLFQSPRALCASCHALARPGGAKGGDTGPELTRIREKYDRAALLEQILRPNAAIAFGYETWIVERADGSALSGFVLAEGDPLVLRDVAGVRHVLAADELVARRRQSVSTMPEGFATLLEPQELADLVAFLLDDPEAPPRLGAERALFDGRTLAGWTAFLADAQADPAAVWRVEEGELVCAGTPAGYLRTQERFTSFELELEWRWEGAPGNSGVLLRVQPPDTVWPKSIEAQLQAGSAGDVWNIGEFALAIDPARTDGRHTEKLAPSSERAPGEWNRYRIVLDGGELALWVNGVLQNRASWCEPVPGWIALQSEGAPIRFRSLRLRPIE